MPYRDEGNVKAYGIAPAAQKRPETGGGRLCQVL